MNDENKKILASILNKRPEDIQWSTLVSGYDKFEVKLKGQLNPVIVTGQDIAIARRAQENKYEYKEINS